MHLRISLEILEHACSCDLSEHGLFLNTLQEFFFIHKHSFYQSVKIHRGFHILKARITHLQITKEEPSLKVIFFAMSGPKNQSVR